MSPRLKWRPRETSAVFSRYKIVNFAKVAANIAYRLTFEGFKQKHPEFSVSYFLSRD